LRFTPNDSDNHAAPLWPYTGDRGATIRAVEQIESWRRIPTPLMWMAHARYRADELESTLPLLIELARPSPGRFATLLNDLADTALSALRRFYTQF
jgi:hypothetical protein